MDIKRRIKWKKCGNNGVRGERHPAFRLFGTQTPYAGPLSMESGGRSVRCHKGGLSMARGGRGAAQGPLLSDSRAPAPPHPVPSLLPALLFLLLVALIIYPIPHSTLKTDTQCWILPEFPIKGKWGKWGKWGKRGTGN